MSVGPGHLHDEIHARTCAGIVVLFELLREPLGLSIELPEKAFAAALPGRLQRFPRGGGVAERLVDVSHNPQAAVRLAAHLREKQPDGRNLAVLAMLKDKDVSGYLAAVEDLISGWFVASNPDCRGMDAPVVPSAESATMSLVPET